MDGTLRLAKTGVSYLPCAAGVLEDPLSSARATATECVPGATGRWGGASHGSGTRTATSAPPAPPCQLCRLLLSRSLWPEFLGADGRGARAPYCSTSAEANV